MNEEKLYKKTKALLRKWGVSDEEVEDFIKDLKDAADRDDDGDVTNDVRRAEDKIEAEGEDSQTEKDRVDEAVGDDIADEDKEDSQSTDDRVDEAEGEDKHLEEVHEEAHEEVQEDRIGRLEEKLDKVIAYLMGSDDEDGEAFDRAKSRYGVNAGVFATPSDNVGPKPMTAKDAVEVFRNAKKR